MPCVTFEGIDPDRSWSFSAPGGGGEIAVPVGRCLSVNTVEAAVDAAAAGIGVARALTYRCAAALAEGVVVRVLRTFEPAPLPAHLLHASRDPQHLKLRWFLDHVKPLLQRRLAEVERTVGAAERGGEGWPARPAVPRAPEFPDTRPAGQVSKK